LSPAALQVSSLRGWAPPIAASPRGAGAGEGAHPPRPSSSRNAEPPTAAAPSSALKAWPTSWGRKAGANRCCAWTAIAAAFVLRVPSGRGEGRGEKWAVEERHRDGREVIYSGGETGRCGDGEETWGVCLPAWLCGGDCTETKAVGFFVYNIR
jgi:hypothetical protein